MPRYTPTVTELCLAADPIDPAVTPADLDRVHESLADGQLSLMNALASLRVVRLER